MISVTGAMIILLTGIADTVAVFIHMLCTGNIYLCPTTRASAVKVNVVMLCARRKVLAAVVTLIIEVIIEAIYALGILVYLKYSIGKPCLARYVGYNNCLTVSDYDLLYGRCGVLIIHHYDVAVGVLKVARYTAYRLSFFIRQKDVKLDKGANPRGSGFYVRVDDGNDNVRIFPANSFFGTIPWTRWEFNYRTSKKPLGTSYKPYIHLILRNCSGQAWVDKIELVEVSEHSKK